MTPEEALKHIAALVRDVHADSKPAVFWPTIEAVKGIVRKVEEDDAAARKEVRSIIRKATAKGAG